MKIDAVQVDVRLFADDLGLLILACRAAASDLPALAADRAVAVARGAHVENMASLFEALFFAARMAERPRDGLRLGQVVNEWQPAEGSITRT